MRNKEIISALSELSKLSRMLSAHPDRDYTFLNQLTEEEAMDLIHIVSGELFPEYSSAPDSDESYPVKPGKAKTTYMQ